MGRRRENQAGIRRQVSKHCVGKWGLEEDAGRCRKAGETLPELGSRAAEQGKDEKVLQC